MITNHLATMVKFLKNIRFFKHDKKIILEEFIVGIAQYGGPCLKLTV